MQKLMHSRNDPMALVPIYIILSSSLEGMTDDPDQRRQIATQI